MIDKKDEFEKEMTLFDLLSMMHIPPQLHVWNVKYTDKNGEIHNVRYTGLCTDKKKSESAQ